MSDHAGAAAAARSTDFAPAPTFRCKQCGREIARQLSTQKWCSNRCQKAWDRARRLQATKWRYCAECGLRFAKPTKPGTQKYCGIDCREEAHRRLSRESMQRLRDERKVKVSA